MTIKYMAEYKDPKIAKRIVNRIKKASTKNVRLMEVCGTHTMSIFRNGIRSLLPETISLLSGPGCPVCVTSQSEIDGFIRLAEQDDTILATFGDLMKVPGTFSSLQKERAKGKDIRIVYSALDALDIAQKNPDKHVVFIGVGFETTAPTIAASIISAGQMGLANYHVFPAHKLVPPALAALMENKIVKVDGFILPGHVSVITGLNAYRFVVEKYGIPCVVAGFEPVDILQAILMLVDQIQNNTAKLQNGYKRAVTLEGNQKAMKIMHQIFETVDANWRGLGTIPKSGLKIKKEFAPFDAQNVFDIETVEVKEPKGCACGDILTGVKTPPQCPLYKTVCTPTEPVGPCMVSSEGSCAAYFRYFDDCRSSYMSLTLTV